MWLGTSRGVRPVGGSAQLDENRRSVTLGRIVGEPEKCPRKRAMQLKKCRTSRLRAMLAMASYSVRYLCEVKRATIVITRSIIRMFTMENLGQAKQVASGTLRTSE